MQEQEQKQELEVGLKLEPKLEMEVFGRCLKPWVLGPGCCRRVAG